MPRGMMGFGRRCVHAGLRTLAFFLAVSGVYAEGPTVVEVPGTPALLLSNFNLAPLGYATSEFFVTASSLFESRCGCAREIPAP